MRKIEQHILPKWNLSNFNHHQTTNISQSNVFNYFQVPKRLQSKMNSVMPWRKKLCKSTSTKYIIIEVDRWISADSGVSKHTWRPKNENKTDYFLKDKSSKFYWVSLSVWWLPKLGPEQDEAGWEMGAQNQHNLHYQGSEKWQNITLTEHSVGK